MVEEMADYKDEMVGSHPSMQALKKLIERVSKSPTRTILIYGETGTGKGLVARMIHRASARASKEFVDINCAAIPASLLESELFGHERGAFTGAVERKLGLIEAANHGTVFLDEIREMDPVLQVKLLSLLDTHQFRRVGSVKNNSVDVRFIAATNKILLSEVESGHFREDLYYRLQVVSLNLPPLRERGDDVLAMSDFFIKKYNAVYSRNVQGLAPETEQIFLKYPWPGNVRELENLLERIFILEDDNTVLPKHLPDRILRTVRSGLTTVPSRLMPETVPEEGLQEATANFQRVMIANALSANEDNIQSTAAALKISRHALRHQMIKLGM
ncbi:sigma-54 interaction domain-containing protein [Pseudogemmobacter sp. W21_MBD1_M6]|uniref:sigma-54 interaction domain-containing protein n=1 Tax=Pseudogemmobacter sp. W21_MBD1_M6 TaxID=3240271 RepID=UPI003F99E225